MNNHRLNTLPEIISGATNQTRIVSGVGRSLKVGGAKFDGHHGGRAMPLPQPARGVL